MVAYNDLLNCSASTSWIIDEASTNFTNSKNMYASTADQMIEKFTYILVAKGEGSVL